MDREEGGGVGTVAVEHDEGGGTDDGQPWMSSGLRDDAGGGEGGAARGRGKASGSSSAVSRSSGSGDSAVYSMGDPGDAGSSSSGGAGDIADRGAKDAAERCSAPGQAGDAGGAGGAGTRRCERHGRGRGDRGCEGEAERAEGRGDGTTPGGVCAGRALGDVAGGDRLTRPRLSRRAMTKAAQRAFSRAPDIEDCASGSARYKDEHVRVRTWRLATWARAAARDAGPLSCRANGTRSAVPRLLLTLGWASGHACPPRAGCEGHTSAALRGAQPGRVTIGQPAHAAQTRRQRRRHGSAHQPRIPRGPSRAPSTYTSFQRRESLRRPSNVTGPFRSLDSRRRRARGFIYSPRDTVVWGRCALANEWKPLPIESLPPSASTSNCSSAWK